MVAGLQPWQFFLATLAGWINRHQQVAIDYLHAENRVLHEQLGGRQLRLTDEQRRRLAIAGKAVGRKSIDFLDHTASRTAPAPSGATVVLGTPHDRADGTDRTGPALA